MKMTDPYEAAKKEFDNIELLGPIIPTPITVQVKRKWWQFWKPKYREVSRYTLDNVLAIGPGDKRFIRHETNTLVRGHPTHLAARPVSDDGYIICGEDHRGLKIKPPENIMIPYSDPNLFAKIIGFSQNNLMKDSASR